jgi:formate hydrogenlyase transcriptional activator
MSLADPWERIRMNSSLRFHAPFTRYGFAVIAVATSTSLTFGLRGLGIVHSSFVLFYPAIVLVAMWSGFGPGILAAALAATAGGYFFMEPTNSFVVRTPEDVIAPALFAFVGVLLTVLTRSRSQARQALRVSEDELNRAQSVAHIGSWHYDIKRTTLRLSDETCNILGLPLQSSVSLQQAFEMVHPDDRDRVNDAWTAALGCGEYDDQSRVLVAGQTRWVRVRAKVELGADGRATKAVGTIQDITERRTAEDALWESEDRYRDLVEHSEDLVCTHDLEGHLLSVNAAPARILGYTPEELLKIPMRDLIIPEGRASFDQYLERLRNGSKVETGLLCVITRSGEWRTWEYRNTLRTEGVPEPIVRGMAHDITDRRRAELALQESEERLWLAQEVAHIGTFDRNLLTGESTWTPQMEAMYGLKPGTFPRTIEEFLKLVHPEDREHVAGLVKKSMESGEVQGEWRIQWTDGTVRWITGCWKVFKDSVGTPLRVIGIDYDITERKVAEEVVRLSEERFRVALKGSPTAVFSQDRDLRYTWAYNLASLTPAQLLGKTDDQIMRPEDARRFRELKQKVLKTGVGIREEVTTFRNGSNLTYDLIIEPLFDSKGNIIGITGAAIDIARMRELADSLEQQRDKLVQEKSYLEGQIEAELGFEEIIGQSPPLREVLKKVRIVAPTDSTVLLLGETGTGKELVARALHALSARHEKSFIKLNCAAVPSGLLESELFGHEKGAFTGAVNQKLGRLELADGGTLFLDEVGELPLELQPKLLRVLQDREFERLGGVRTLHVDVRIISATNCDLQRDVADRNFREDLFYRLNVFPIFLPPLRERRSDIPVLVSHFVKKYSHRMGRHIEVIPTDTMQVLQNWNWPGNVRELENMIERMVILSKGNVLAAPPVELRMPQENSEDNLVDMERDYILRVLHETRGVVSGVDGAANRLGLKRTTLQSMLKRLGIDPSEYRRGTGTLGE